MPGREREARVRTEERDYVKDAVLGPSRAARSGERSFALVPFASPQSFFFRLVSWEERTPLSAGVKTNERLQPNHFPRVPSRDPAV